jgi:nitrous oxidase accessory protein
MRNAPSSTTRTEPDRRQPFEGCPIGIHFTAGSERNALRQRLHRQPHPGQIRRHPRYRMEPWRPRQLLVRPSGLRSDGDGIADARFRPNDLMDHILWSQPAASLLLGSPAVQLVRWRRPISRHPARRRAGQPPPDAPARIAVPPNMPAWRPSRGRAGPGRTRQMTTTLDPLTGSLSAFDGTARSTGQLHRRPRRAGGAAGP